jgi:CspA family cold shock protein
MPRATVKCFHDAKGYGFLTRDDGEDVFVHDSSIAGDGSRTLTSDQTVDYEAQPGPRGGFALRVVVSR